MLPLYSVEDRTSSFRKSTLKSTRDDPLRSRIFPWVISSVGRYLMHFYRFIYSSSTSRRASLSSPLPSPAVAAVTTRTRPFLLACFFVLSPTSSPIPRFSLSPYVPSSAPLLATRSFISTLFLRPFQLFIRFSPPPLKQNERRARLVSIKEWINVDWKGIKKHVRVYTHTYTQTHIDMYERKKERYTCASAHDRARRAGVFVHLYLRIEENKLKSAIAVVQSKFVLTNATNWISLVRYLWMYSSSAETRSSFLYHFDQKSSRR